MSDTPKDTQPQKQPAPKTPASADAEKAVLGSLLNNNDLFDDIYGLVQANSFVSPNHEEIFKLIQALKNSGQAADPITVNALAQTNAPSGHSITLELLTDLCFYTPGSENTLSYAKIIADKAKLRALLDACAAIVNLIDKPVNSGGSSRSTEDILDIADSKIFSIATAADGADGPRKINEFSKIAWEKLAALKDNPNGITGLPMGFKRLDAMTTGLHPGELVVIAARPSMGKTTFALNIIENMCARYQQINQPVPASILFSLEMPGDQLIMRMLSSLANVDHDKLRTGEINDKDTSSLIDSMAALDSYNILIDDSNALSTTQIRSRIRKVKRMLCKGVELGLVMIDYLQLMQSAPELSQANRTTQVSHDTRMLKMIAREFNVPVVVLSQLNRELEKRGDKTPQMSDLRDSGSIEQDADLIMFIYRAEVYEKNVPKLKGKAQIVIGKQRNGPVGSVYLNYVNTRSKFSDPLPDQMDMEHMADDFDDDGSYSVGTFTKKLQSEDNSNIGVYRG